MAYPAYGYPAYGYNPQQTYMPQQQMQPQQMPAAQMAQAFACRPVTSREEAVAAQTDYFSSGLVMPDLGHGVIYLKRFNQQTGASDFFEYRLAADEKEQPAAAQFVTVEEFDRFQKELARRLGGKIKGEVVEEYD